MLAELAPSALAALLARVSDFALLIDHSGQVTEIIAASEELKAFVTRSLLGRPWRETVTAEGEPRIDRYLKQLHDEGDEPLRFDVVHPIEGDAELPVTYQAMTLNGSGDLIAVAQDLRPMASLRQQLLNAQQALEQDYWRLRRIETRYRRLFEMSSDAILVVDDQSGRVLEASPVANELLVGHGESLVGKPFPRGFAPEGQADVEAMLMEARRTGEGTLSGVASADAEHLYSVNASLLKQGDEARILVRVTDERGSVAGSDPFQSPILRDSPDAIVHTNPQGRILAANRTFCEVIQVTGDDQVRGRLLDNWLGRSTVDLNVLLNNLRQRDTVRLFSSVLRSRHGTLTEIELCARRLDILGEPTYAFYMRDVERRVATEHPRSLNLPRSIEQVTQQVGRVPLKELVRDSTDIIEAMCIEAALELTSGNRASAAELLGLSRQSLYTKLRRYGIGDSEAEAE